jgi:hypothetical protein
VAACWTAAEARAVRLRGLLLAADAPAAHRLTADDVAGAVRRIAEWFGALQAQDVGSLLWSLGVRIPGVTVSAVRTAVGSRAVLRTWPMRGTLHLVPAADARWMLDLMADRRRTAMDTRHRQLGLSPADVARGVDVLGAALVGRTLTRAQCLDTLERAGLPIAGQAGYHLIGAACRAGVVCLAGEAAREQTFALLDEWAPDQESPDRDTALARIAERFVRSHGPVTRKDLAGWTGLTLTDVDRGLAGCADAVREVEVDGVRMVAPTSALEVAPRPRAFLALPGFDEFLLGYKDRSLVLAPEHRHAIVPGGNGVFRPTLVHDGRVVGTWRRTTSRSRTAIDADPFDGVPPAAADRAALDAELTRYAGFVEAEDVRIRWSA